MHDNNLPAGSGVGAYCIRPLRDLNALNVRDFLEEWRDPETGEPWNKQAPMPDLPEAVISGTRLRYLEAYTRLTGRPAPV